MALVLRGDLDRKITVSELDGNFTYLSSNIAAATASIATIRTNLATATASLAQGLSGTNRFNFIFLSAGVTYSATFSFVGGILATYSSPYTL